MEFVKLRAKETYMSTIVQLTKLFPMGVSINNSGTAMSIYWNWTIG